MEKKNDGCGVQHCVTYEIAQALVEPRFECEQRHESWLSPGVRQRATRSVLAGGALPLPMLCVVPRAHAACAPEQGAVVMRGVDRVDITDNV